MFPSRPVTLPTTQLTNPPLSLTAPNAPVSTTSSSTPAGSKKSKPGFLSRFMHAAEPRILSPSVSCRKRKFPLCIWIWAGFSFFLQLNISILIFDHGVFRGTPRDSGGEGNWGSEFFLQWMGFSFLTGFMGLEGWLRDRCGTEGNWFFFFGTGRHGYGVGRHKC